MAKYSILIIDDEDARNDPYKQFLSDSFDLIILNNIDLNLIQESVDDAKVDCILLDMVLNKGRADQQKELFQSVIEIIGNRKPLILTSRNFGTIVSWINNLGQDKGSNVIYYFGWDELYKEDGSIKDFVSAEIMRSRIEFGLNNYYKKSNSKKSDDESINILHISDIQFGDPDFTNDAKILSERLIAEYIISQLKVKVDFIAITGDIAFSGLPSEFERGLDWINNLARYLFPSDFHNYGERMLVVPGNHDVNLSLSAADHIIYVFAKENKIEAKDRVAARAASISDHQPIALSPFGSFAFSLTGDPLWMEKQSNLCFVNNKFSKWGIQFVLLNTVMELGFMEPRKISLPPDPIQRLGRSVAKGNNNLFTIYLAHNGPEDLGYIRSADQPTSVTSLFSLVNSIGGHLFLHGHRHKIEKLYEMPFEGRFSSKMKYGQTGSVSLSKKVQANGSRRGFSMIELIREKGTVKSYSHNCFEFDEHEIIKVERKSSQVNL